MKRQMLFGTMLSLTLAAGLAAQGQTPPQGQSQPPAGQTQTPRTTPSDQSASDRTVTITGCVQAGAAGAGAATGAPTTGSTGAATGAQAGQRGGFVLTDVRPAGSSTTGATAGTTGTSGAPGASSYRLTGSEDLQQYVGKRVEITGMVAGRAGSSSTGSTTGAATGATTGATPGSTSDTTAGSRTGAGAGAGDTPMLRVTSVKPATGDCK